MEKITPRWTVPNLDRMTADELREFIRTLPESVPHAVRVDLKAYVGNRVASRAWKAVGKISEAGKCNERCEDIYARIPIKYRWI